MLWLVHNSVVRKTIKSVAGLDKNYLPQNRVLIVTKQGAHYYEC